MTYEDMMILEQQYNNQFNEKPQGNDYIDFMEDVANEYIYKE